MKQIKEIMRVIISVMSVDPWDNLTAKELKAEIAKLRFKKMLVIPISSLRTFPEVFFLVREERK